MRLKNNPPRNYIITSQRRTKRNSNPTRCLHQWQTLNILRYFMRGRGAEEKKILIKIKIRCSFKPLFALSLERILGIFCPRLFILVKNAKKCDTKCLPVCKIEKRKLQISEYIYTSEHTLNLCFCWVKSINGSWNRFGRLRR